MSARLFPDLGRRQRSLLDDPVAEPPPRDGAALGEADAPVLRGSPAALRPPPPHLEGHPLDGGVGAVRHPGLPHLRQFRGARGVQEALEREVRPGDGDHVRAQPDLQAELDEVELHTAVSEVRAPWGR